MKLYQIILCFGNYRVHWAFDYMSANGRIENMSRLEFRPALHYYAEQSGIWVQDGKRHTWFREARG